jgi:hypothetical protein
MTGEADPFEVLERIMTEHPTATFAELAALEENARLRKLVESLAKRVEAQAMVLDHDLGDEPAR